MTLSLYLVSDRCVVSQPDLKNTLQRKAQIAFQRGTRHRASHSVLGCLPGGSTTQSRTRISWLDKETYNDARRRRPAVR